MCCVTLDWDAGSQVARCRPRRREGLLGVRAAATSLRYSSPSAASIRHSSGRIPLPAAPSRAARSAASALGTAECCQRRPAQQAEARQSPLTASVDIRGSGDQPVGDHERLFGIVQRQRQLRPGVPALSLSMCLLRHIEGKYCFEQRGGSPRYPVRRDRHARGR